MDTPAVCKNLNGGATTSLSLLHIGGVHHLKTEKVLWPKGGEGRGRGKGGGVYTQIFFFLFT